MWNRFLLFFIDQIATARALVSIAAFDPSVHVPCSAVSDSLGAGYLSFSKDVVCQIKPSGSPYDYISPDFFKEVLPNSGKSVLAIICNSVSSGVVPHIFDTLPFNPCLRNVALINPAVLFLKFWKKWCTLI